MIRGSSVKVVESAAAIALENGGVAVSVTLAGIRGASGGDKTIRQQGDCTGLANGSNTVFSLPVLPVGDSLIVYRNGVKQRPSDDFSRIGLLLTFVTAPQIGDSITFDLENTT